MRVGSDVRLIVHKTDSSFLLCYVDHHDKAYQWAERRLETHPSTGAAQWVEIRESSAPKRSRHVRVQCWKKLACLTECSMSMWRRCQVRHHYALCTMHLAKGLEFRAVAVMACDDEVIPLQERIEAIADEADLEEVYNTERHLLYVACTRARDRLFISGVEPCSEFLSDLMS